MQLIPRNNYPTALCQDRSVYADNPVNQVGYYRFQGVLSVLNDPAEVITAKSQLAWRASAALLQFSGMIC